MKKIIIYAICLLWIGPVFSQQVSRGMARTVSNNFFQMYLGRNDSVSSVEGIIENETICLYDVEMESGAWCFVSADMRLPSILVYGYDGRDDDDVPEAYLDMLEFYKRSVDSLVRENPEDVIINPEWNNLLNPPKSVRPFTSGDNILDMARGVPLAWGQGYNNDGTCHPSYNQACPDEDDWTCPAPYTGHCKCGAKPVGCGAVAMGQLMWCWQWPRKSKYRTYYWDVMPAALYSTSSSVEIENLTRFLRDCGRSSDMYYCCGGSFTFMNDIEGSLNRDFGYKGTRIHDYSDWSQSRYGDAWEQLIRSEIVNGRPVLFYGESFTPITGHYFLVDGYQGSENDIFFHVNWGHRGEYNCYCRLSRLYYVKDNGEKKYYNCANAAIVGISPTYNDININSVSYYEILPNFTKREYASNGIFLPGNNWDLIVRNGANYYLESGNEIELLPGFEAEYGSEFEAKIDANWQNNMVPNVVYVPSSMTLNSDYEAIVENADSWEFALYDSTGDAPVVRTAGTISTQAVVLWDGSGVEPGGYFSLISLKNSYGRRVTYEYQLTILPQDDLMYYTNGERAVMVGCGESTSPLVIPNPTDGPLTMSTDGMAQAVLVYTLSGNPVGGWRIVALTETSLSIDVSALAPGTYLLSVTSPTGTRTAKFIRR